MEALRPYQQALPDKLAACDAQNVLCVAPTGAGKTRMMARVAAKHGAPSLAMAHRGELIEQISAAYAREGIPHRILAPADIVRMCACDMVRERADVTVAGVDALRVRGWGDAPSPSLVQPDEGHHMQPDNKWGRARALFPAARCIGWSATPCRLDRRPLRASYDELLVGPTMRELIDAGYLAPYRIYGLPQAIDTTSIPISPSGDYNQPALQAAARSSRIVGDVVQHYTRLAPGQSGVTFVAGVEMARAHAEAFRAAGVSAAVLHAGTPAADRRDLIRAYRNGAILQVCNVDVLGEGFDMPGISVVSMARPTMSYSLYVQQFGRPLRPSPGKIGLVLDHVGAVLRHGLPDWPPAWTLDGGRVQSSNPNPVRVCGACYLAYSSFDPVCPYCGWSPTPAPRPTPDAVEGDLTLYDPDDLAQLRALIDRRRGAPLLPQSLPPHARRAAARRWTDRAVAIHAMSQTIDHWAGRLHAETGDSMQALYRRFYLAYGVDVLGAQALPTAEMEVLRMAIMASVDGVE